MSFKGPSEFPAESNISTLTRSRFIIQIESASKAWVNWKYAQSSQLAVLRTVFCEPPGTGGVAPKYLSTLSFLRPGLNYISFSCFQWIVDKVGWVEIWDKTYPIFDSFRGIVIDLKEFIASLKSLGGAIIVIRFHHFETVRRWIKIYSCLEPFSLAWRPVGTNWVPVSIPSWPSAVPCTYIYLRRDSGLSSLTKVGYKNSFGCFSQNVCHPCHSFGTGATTFGMVSF